MDAIGMHFGGASRHQDSEISYLKGNVEAKHYKYESLEAESVDQGKSR